MILPNVEMRILPMSRENPVNIHCIFSPELSQDQLNSRFFNQLHFSYKEQSFSATRDELIRLGKAIKADCVDNYEAYHKGVEQFVVTIKDLEDLFKNAHDLRDDTIIVVANSGKDGASGITAHSDYSTNSGMSQLDATKQRVYQFADLVFSGNPRDTKYFLGKGPDSEEIIKNKCGSIMGCIHGSDAHSLQDVFEPDEKRYCWIKSNPTFNGLKQIIYEPESRILISSVPPKAKPDYQVIDNVEIADSSFQKEPIYFNDKLTCIIGGKSTGKSLLLHNVALAIDEKQVKEKADITETKIENRRLDGARVNWRDGSNSIQGITDSHKIIYIPQTYLNRLSDEKEELTEIDKIISEIVLINPDAQKSYSEMEDAINNQKTKIDHLIYEVIQANEKVKEKKNAQSDIGTWEGIKKEINKLNEQKGALTKDAAISEEDIEKYNKAVKMSNSKKEEIDNLDVGVKSI